MSTALAILSWVCSEHGLAAAAIVVALAHTVQAVWASHDARAAKIEKLAYSAWYSVEGLGKEAGWKGVDKMTAYRATFGRMAPLLGLELTPDDDRLLAELAKQYAATAKAAPMPPPAPVPR